MIVWLASYPRSGNTLLRSTSHKNFGLQTHSLYDDTQDIAKTQALTSKIGHVSHGLSKEAFFFKARNSTRTLFIKTHEPPLDESKAIYTVRDGRSAAVSYFHYIKDFSPFFDVSLEDVILGACMFGAWSDHYLKWRPHIRPNTLVLRYEDLVHHPGEVLARLSDFLERPILDPEAPVFDDLKAIDPRFFRAGCNTRNIDEFSEETLGLFWLLHGPLMKRLGYGEPHMSDNPLLDQKVRERLAHLQMSIDMLEAERHQLQCERSDLQQAMQNMQDSRWWRVGQALRLATEPSAARH